MPSLTQSIATYTYIDRPTIDLGTIDLNNTEIALLTQVDTLMSAAAASFNARQYADAINSYHAAESLMYAHLDPQWVPELGGKIRPLLPRDPSLFSPLLSAASQWLNVMPAPAPASPVRPTTAVNQQLLSSVAGLHGAGITPVSIDLASAYSALADLRLATIYNDQGNSGASAVAEQRAVTLDPVIAKGFGSIGTTPTPTPTATPTPTPTPVIRGHGEAMATALAGARITSDLSISRVVPIETKPSLPISLLATKQVGLIVGSAGSYSIKPVQWALNANPDISQLTTLIYTAHAAAKTLPDALNNVSTMWERAALLPHDYFYTVPLALAECYEAMGDYASAETYYLQAAQYTYINTAIEGPYVWIQLANLYSTWGNSVYQQGDSKTAATVYSKVLTVGSTTPPSTPLYTLAGLAAGATIAKALIPQLSTLATKGASSVSADDTAFASVLLKLYGKLNQINGGLDYWGNWANAIPIWTFSYLQQVAINFAQFALNAEQEVINFLSQSDAATLTQTQLQNQVNQATAQASVAMSQLQGAQDQFTVYQDGLTLANTRAQDAANDASEYNALNSEAITLQAEATQNQGGDSGDYNGLQNLASQLLSGNSISADNPTLAAAAQLAGNQLSQQYQVDSMTRTATEMQQAATQAQAQVTAAGDQVAAAFASAVAAQLDANNAAQSLAVFNADTFTPQVWRSMGDFMLQIYDQYFFMALAAAKLMQQAYNFENDTSLTYIKDSYAGVVDGLLAADALMEDIQQFTADLVTSKRGKKQYVKTSISLATNYGYLFQTQLLKTGTMTFETTLDDFDSVFPGTYAGRIQSVSVDIQGIVPPTGISGTLTNGGISFYRLPSDIATPAAPSKLRIQNSDTLVLSDYNPAVDGQLNSTTGNQLGIFEGAGVASTWTLSLPKQLNNINYGTLTDVVLTFLYETRFDPQLVPTVLSQLASRPGFYSREWSIPIGWLYPDLFYSFVNTGTLTLSLDASDFALNQTKPTITAVSLLVAMKPGTSAQGITISLTPPGRSAVSGATDATGAITSQGSGAPWAAAPGGSALGNWVITLPAASNPTLAPGGVLNLSNLLNLVLVLDYTFTPRT
jgi:Tc toxin complex TcA C-terminal TcB-binding domain